MRTNSIWMKPLIVLAPALLLAVARPANADTIYVNGDCGDDAWTGTNPDCAEPDGPKATIQAAIGVAINGDLIRVAPGTYRELINFLGKEITLRSADGPETTIINGDTDNNGTGNGIVVLCVNNETEFTVLDGFTITKGVSQLAGGMRNENASPTVTNCIFTLNEAQFGAGMSNNNASPTVTNCIFRLNSGTIGGGMLNGGNSSPMVTDCIFELNTAGGFNARGAGMANDGTSSPTVTNCTFSNNVVPGIYNGGGMYNAGLSPTVTNCTFSDNAASAGGGMFNDGGTPTVTNCTFTRNRAVGGGGGMANRQSTTPTVTNCTFSLNTAGQSGGGIYARGGTFTNCTFSNNVSDDSGGGMFIGFGAHTITNCIFTLNTAANLGGGMFIRSQGDAAVTNCTFSLNRAEQNGGAISTGGGMVANCIVWGNSSPGVDEIFVTFGPPPVTYSDVRGGFPGEGNIDLDPIFVDPANGDFHLAPGSPCIDTADNAAAALGIMTDLDGNPRVMDGVPGLPCVVDMGVYEFDGSVCPCDPCDMNCDGVVNAFDIEPFLDILFNNLRRCNFCTANTNGDGAIDAFDIEPFLECLFP